MARVAVDAVGRDEAHEMQRVRVALASRHRVDERGLLEEIAVADALVDARQVLIDDASRAHRDVADFRVAHLPGGKADLFAGRLQRRMREAIEQLEVGRRSRQLDGVARALFAQAPAVEHDKNERSAPALSCVEGS